MILAEAAAFIPVGVFWMHASFAGFPKELIEAARVDGASNFTIGDRSPIEHRDGGRSTE